MNNKLVIDFFATIGMPNFELVKIIEHINKELGGDFNSDASFSYVNNTLMQYFSQNS